MREQPHAGPHQVVGDGGPESAAPDQADLRALQPFLARPSNIGHEHLPAVAKEANLLGHQPPAPVPVSAPLVILMSGSR